MAHEGIAVDIGGGHYAEYFTLACDRCGKGTYRAVATHGGDLFDPEGPQLCQACHTAAIEAGRDSWRAHMITAGLQDAGLADDLPFD